MAALDNFRREMVAPYAFQTPGEISDLLAACIQRACAEAGLKEADIFGGAGQVTMFLSDKSFWEAVIVGPNAYQFYPGFDRGDHIVWANVWVGENYDLEKFIAAVEQEIQAARAEGNAP